MRKIYTLLLLLAASTMVKAQSTTTTVNFTFAPDPVTNNMVFSNTSTLPGDGVKKAYWTFGDGSGTMTAPLAGTSHHYTSAGTYQVCLKIYKYPTNSNDSILLGSECKSVTLQQTCTANFQFHDSVTTNPLVHHVGFFGTGSNNANHPITQVCWNFGDGTDTCMTASAGTSITSFLNIRHNYAQNGTYNVCLKIKYDGGCIAEKCNTVVLNAPVIADSCTANFTISPITFTPLGRKFIAHPWHSNNKKPVRICWTFGDGKDTCIQYAASYTGDYLVEHKYANYGQYEVCVTIKYDGGCEKRKCNPVTIFQPVPADSCAANFTVQPISATPLGRKFIAQPWHNNNKKPVRICWTFGDGKDTCIQYVTSYTGDFWVEHKYVNYGQYEVCVTIKYDGGCEKKKCNPVIVSQPTPVDTCYFELNEAPVSVAGLERRFYVGLMANRRAEKICWNFGDGTDTCVILSNPVNPQQLMITHHYAAPGNYLVCAKVTYVGGCIATRCRQVSISIPQNNICGGYMTDSVVSLNTIRFKGTGVQNANDYVTSYAWTFGDGTTGTGQVVNHTYAAAGHYNVCLFMRTNSGCETKICKEVSASGNNQPQLILSPTPVINTLTAVFHSLFQQTVTVKIYSANGLMVRSYVRNAIVGTNTWTFPDVTTLPTGVYSVIVQSSNQFATAIFFKQ